MIQNTGHHGFIGTIDKWHDDLGKLLLKRGEILTAISDSGGGELFKQVGHLLKPGGRLVCYGMYVGIHF